MTSSAAPTAILIMTIVLGPLLVRTRIILAATTIRGIDAVFSTMVREKVDALCVAPGTLFNARRVQLAVLAARHDGVPAVYAGRDYVVAGGLMSYGSDIANAHRQVGLYTARILKGAHPAGSAISQIRTGDQLEHRASAWRGNTG